MGLLYELLFCFMIFPPWVFLSLSLESGHIANVGQVHLIGRGKTEETRLSKHKTRQTRKQRAEGREGGIESLAHGKRFGWWGIRRVYSEERRKFPV